MLSTVDSNRSIAPVENNPLIIVKIKLTFAKEVFH